MPVCVVHTGLLMPWNEPYTPGQGDTAPDPVSTQTPVSSTVSIVIPVFNEADNVERLHREICETLSRISPTCEIIFVNDGSTDNTLRALQALRPVTIINFRRNFGQTAAIDAGIKHASGDIIVTLDGDGQNDPADIPLLLEKIREGYDVVSGWRWQRKDTFGKRFVSRGARALRSLFIRDHVQDSGCTLKAYRRECFEHVDLYGEMHRFIPAILAWRGFRIGEVRVNHRPRNAGATKYNWKRIPKGLLDMVSVWFWRKYSNRPLHLFGGLGLLSGLLGFFLLAALLILRAFGTIHLEGRIWPLIAVFLILMGLQLFVSGILADMVVRSYYKTTRQWPYQIKEIVKH